MLAIPPSQSRARPHGQQHSDKSAFSNFQRFSAALSGFLRPPLRGATAPPNPPHRRPAPEALFGGVPAGA
eukprot:15432442-Alexandrium_andersonii.AAC.1